MKKYNLSKHLKAKPRKDLPGHLPPKPKEVDATDFAKKLGQISDRLRGLMLGD